MENSTLQHSGVRGMKWGIRRYQNKDGSLTPAGRKHYAKETEKIKVAKAKLAAEKKVLANEKKTAAKIQKLDAAKKKVEAEKKALKEEKKRLKSGEKIEENKKTPDELKQEREAARKKAVESGSATEVLKFKGEYTKAEMDAISNRLSWEKNMKDYSKQELDTGKSKTEKLMDKVGKATNYAETGIKAYNTIANIFNAVQSDHTLPRISTNTKDDNISQRKASKKEKAKAKEAEEKRKKQEAEGDAKREERAKKKAEAEKETFTGTVEGEGTSKRNTSNAKSKPSDYYDPIDSYGDFVNESASNPPAVTTNRGRSWVAGYLEDKRR